MVQVNNKQDLPTITFIELATGRLSGLLSWDEFDRICKYITETLDVGWYIYALNGHPPQQLATSNELDHFIASLNKNIHQDYAREHCGIAYVDSLTEPTLVKIFDPKLLKSICNVNGVTPHHGWIISQQKPVDLHVGTRVDTNNQYDESGATKAEKILDARYTGCPLPVINTCRALQDMSKGGLLEIMTIEPGAVKDVSIICDQTGDKLVSHEQTRNGYSFFVQKM